MELGRGDFEGMHQPVFGGHTKLRLYLEMPLIAFYCLSHQQVAILNLILVEGKTMIRLTFMMVPW